MNDIQRGLTCLGLAVASAPAAAQFVEHTIATDITFGYQVLAADMDRDGDPDIVALGAQLTELYWFENPGWERHVLTDQATGMINMDAADVDGDGIPEIGLAYGFSTNPSRSEGNIAILEHTGDPTAKWTLTEIDAIPTSHRIRWGRIDAETEALINAPILHADAEGFEDPDRLPTPLVYYRPGDWERETITLENQGVVHGVMSFDLDEDGIDEVLSAGRLGVHAHALGSRGRWSRRQLSAGVDEPYPNGGSSDLGGGMLAGQAFFVAIEPFHGNEVAVYRQGAGDAWSRLVIDTELVNGHSLLVADLSGDGNGEIIAAGTRGPQNLYLYRAADASGDRWERTIIDDAISANSCDAADINGDGLTDVTCIDNRAPFSVKWYENTGDW